MPTGRGMHRHHWKVKKEGRRTLPPATLLHIEKTQWSPNCRRQLSRPGTISATLCRNPGQYLAAVGTFPPACLPCHLCHSCQSLCYVPDAKTVSNVAQIPRVGSIEIQGRQDQCQVQSIVKAIPGLSGTRAGHQIYVAGQQG